MKTILNEKLEELIKLIKKFLTFQVGVHELSQFAWETIAFFSSAEKDNLPSHEKFEPEFWYAIWQIQHLAGEPDDSLLRSQINKTLDYLERKQTLPKEYAGTRP